MSKSPLMVFQVRCLVGLVSGNEVNSTGKIPNLNMPKGRRRDREEQSMQRRDFSLSLLGARGTVTRRACQRNLHTRKSTSNQAHSSKKAIASVCSGGE